MLSPRRCGTTEKRMGLVNIVDSGIKFLKSSARQHSRTGRHVGESEGLNGPVDSAGLRTVLEQVRTHQSSEPQTHKILDNNAVWEVLWIEENVLPWWSCVLLWTQPVTKSFQMLEVHYITILSIRARLYASFRYSRYRDTWNPLLSWVMHVSIKKDQVGREWTYLRDRMIATFATHAELRGQ